MSLNNVLTKIRRIYHLQRNNSEDYLSNNWFIITAVVLSTLNHPKDIQQLYALIEHDIESMHHLSADDKIQLNIQVVAKLQDALLKGCVAGGFPKSINGLQELYNAIPDRIKERLPKTPIRQEDTWEKIVAQRERGQALFDKIYDRHTKRVMGTMATIYPDLAQTAYAHIYSSILSETASVPAKETSLLVVAGCFVQQVSSQLRGHAYGALHNGASQQELQQVYEASTLLCQHYNVPVLPATPVTSKSKL